MSIEFKESNPALEMPKSKTIVIDGWEMGRVEPKFYSRDTLSWYSCIDLSMKSLRSFLVHGFGQSPHASVADGVISARRERDEMIEKLAWLENQLGTTGKSEEELKRVV